MYRVCIMYFLYFLAIAFLVKDLRYGGFPSRRRDGVKCTGKPTWKFAVTEYTFFFISK